MTDRKVALVTGASRGIGAAIAGALTDAFYVVGTATSDAGVAAVDEALGDQGRGALLDIRDAGSVDALYGKLADDGLVPLALVNNAGITGDNLLLRMKPEEWESVISTNLGGAYRMVRPALRGMMKARWGRIVNVSSVVARMGNPGQSNYVASKAGLEGFTRALAQEVGSRGITVNAVAPGFIETDMTAALDESQVTALVERIPLGTLGRAEDIADAVEFLLSDRASYITGETLHVNGGMYMA